MVNTFNFFVEVLVPQPLLLGLQHAAFLLSTNEGLNLTLLECSKTQEEVAEDLGVSLRTIQRLSVKAKEQNDAKAEAPQRKGGTGRKATYGKKQVKAIEKLIYVSVSAGREKWPFNVLFFLK